MPGATPVYGLPYPLIGEPVDPGAFQALADAADNLLMLQAAEAAQAQARPATWTETATTAAVNVETTSSLTVLNGIDTDGMYNAGTPTFLTVNTTGYYLVQVAGFAPSGFATLTSWRHSILLNGSRWYAQRKNNEDRMSFGGLLKADAGDQISFSMLWTGTGGPASNSTIIYYVSLLVYS